MTVVSYDTWRCHMTVVSYDTSGPSYAMTVVSYDTWSCRTTAVSYDTSRCRTPRSACLRYTVSRGVL